MQRNGRHCGTPTSYECAASEAEAAGEYRTAAEYWIHAAARCLGRQRAAHYRARARRCAATEAVEVNDAM